MPRPAFCGLFSAAALALFLVCSSWAETAAQEAPAVSAPNAKIAFEAGALDLPAPAFLSHAAGTLTLPLGDRFGLQADLSLAAAPGFSAGGALHLFTRDPQGYLLGGALGLVRTPGALVVAAGPEAELYFDRWTLEAWGGLSYVHPAGGPDRVAPFVMADVATYPIDNLRLSLGLSLVDGYGALHGGAEYLLEGAGLPLALTADARLGADGAVRASLGLKAFLGGTPKSLLRRHREDDPSDRGAALYAALGRSTTHPAPARSTPGSSPAESAGATGSTPPAGDNGTPPADTGGGDGTAPANPGGDGSGLGGDGGTSSPGPDGNDGGAGGGDGTSPDNPGGDGGTSPSGPDAGGAGSGDEGSDPPGGEGGSPAEPGGGDAPSLSCDGPGQVPIEVAGEWICGSL